MLGRSRWGERDSPGVLTVPWLWRLAGIVPCTSKKKFRSCRCLRRYRGQLPGSGATLLSYSLFLTDKVFPACELEPATDATSTDRIPATQASTSAPPRSRSATVKNGTEDRWMDDTLSPKPVTVAYRRGRVTVIEQPSGLVTRFTTRIPAGLRRSGPRRHINQLDRDVPSRSPTVPFSASAPVRRAKAGRP
jgi:hypothetical protein